MPFGHVGGGLWRVKDIGSITTFLKMVLSTAVIVILISVSAIAPNPKHVHVSIFIIIYNKFSDAH